MAVAAVLCKRGGELVGLVGAAGEVQGQEADVFATPT